VTIDPAEEAATKKALNEIPLLRDRPNTPRLRRRVLLRDGSTCANPRCKRKLGPDGIA